MIDNVRIYKFGRIVN